MSGADLGRDDAEPPSSRSSNPKSVSSPASSSPSIFASVQASAAATLRAPVPESTPESDASPEATPVQSPDSASDSTSVLPPVSLSASVSVDETVDASFVPSEEAMIDWIKHAIRGVPEQQESAVSTPSRDKYGTHYVLSLSIVDDETMRALNSRYRDRDTFTNVLSFPSGMPALSMLDTSDRGSIQPLGDIVVCQSVIVREAVTQKKPVEHHFAHMLVHSVLHLFGYDHEYADEADVMESLEIRLLAELSIPNPYQQSFQNQ